jgi:hypothetical protein
MNGRFWIALAMLLGGPFALWIGLRGLSLGDGSPLEDGSALFAFAPYIAAACFLVRWPRFVIGNLIVPVIADVFWMLLVGFSDESTSWLEGLFWSVTRLPISFFVFPVTFLVGMRREKWAPMKARVGSE